LLDLIKDLKDFLERIPTSLFFRHFEADWFRDLDLVASGLKKTCLFISLEDDDVIGVLVGD